MALEICEDCGQTYEAGPRTHYCKACRNRRIAAAALKRAAAKAAQKKAAPKEKKKSKLTTLPPAAPRARPKRETPKDYLSACARAAQDNDQTYGAYIAATTKEQRQNMWKKIKRREVKT